MRREITRELKDLLGEEEGGNVADRIYQTYETLGTDEKLFVPELNLHLQKSTAQPEHILKETPKAADRLISKIVYELSFIAFLPDRLLGLLDVLEPFRACARFGDSLPQYALMYPPGIGRDPFYPEEPNYFHRVIFHFKEWAEVIDVTLFGSVHYRAILRPRDNSNHGPQQDHEGTDLDAFGFFMGFDPSIGKEKAIGRLTSGTTRIVWQRTDWL